MYDIDEEATLSDFIIAFLLSARSTRIMNRILWERIKKRRSLNKKTFNQNIYRLKKRGLINVNENGIQLLDHNVRKNFRHKLLRVKPAKTNKVILIFDIPEKERKTRNWLRRQIKAWDFVMIQKSVWLGTGPLPKAFYNHVKLLGIEKDIRVFNVRKADK